MIVQQRRFCINPNDGFMAQLSEFEPIYRAQQTRSNGQCSTENIRNKRRIDDLEEAPSETVNQPTYNGNSVSDQTEQLGITKKSTSCTQREPYNSNKLTNCNYLIEKAIQNSQSPCPHEAMDQEISS